jgi:DNA-directed RNA polymerase sigma subunit (sigma70/sigma32)
MSVVSVDATIGNGEVDSTDTIGNFISHENVDSDYLAACGYKTTEEKSREGEIKVGVGVLMDELPKMGLTKKEIRVIKYLLKGLSMSDISVKLKVTRMRISQISAKAFEKIRNSKVGKHLKGLLA